MLPLVCTFENIRDNRADCYRKGNGGGGSFSFGNNESFGAGMFLMEVLDTNVL